ncbi:MAG: phosphopyruvate hydratase [Verrucomicrobia bacterium]|nr:phosphopyruvate hydratase [Verrucomicrobiota bacterium]
MFTIEKLTALEILDSRGRPTIRTACHLTSGFVGIASVPSGASTGKAEALELRDGDAKRYRGLGCRHAVGHVNLELNAAINNKPISSLSELDQLMIQLDGTPNKSALGANAILSVSLAFARATALQQGLPLYQFFANLIGSPARTLPRPTINLFSGGKHAGGQVPIQDVLVVPASAATIDQALAMTYAVYQCAAEITCKKYGTRALKADEGGLAPPFPSAEAMLDDAVQSINAAGFAPGTDVALAVDVASSHFFENGIYRLGNLSLNSESMIEHLTGWVSRYPIVSIEDGLAEDDWDHWPALRKRIGNQSRVVGDDLLCTNPGRIQRAIDTGSANTLLLKVNQIGTLTEAAEALRLARAASWQVTISARSGETEDNWLADLAVGWRGDQIKVGSITQSERLSKYNRLLEIEAETNFPIVPWPNNAN